VVTAGSADARQAAEELIRRQGAILDLVPDPVVVADPLLRRITYANRAACQLVGYSCHELLEMDYGIVFTELTAQERRQVIKDLQVMSGDMSRLQRVQIRDRNGEMIDCEAHFLAAPDGAGPPLVVAVLRDLREREALSERFRTSEASLRAVFEQSPIGMGIVRIGDSGRRGTIQQANPALADLLGAAGTDLGDTTLDDLVFTPDGELMDALRATAGRGGTVWEAEWIRRGGRGTVWVQISVTPIQLSDTEEPSLLLFAIDADGQRAVQRERQQQTMAARVTAEVATAVLAGQAPSATYRHVVEGVARIFTAGQAVLRLRDPATGQLSVVADFAAQGRASSGTAATGLAGKRGRLVRPGAATWFGAQPGNGGMLTVFRAVGQEPFTSAELDLLSSLAQQLAVAIQLGEAHAEQQAQATERDTYLAALDDALRPLSDPQDIQAVACRLLAEHLQANRAMYLDVEGDVEGDVEEEPVLMVRGEYVQGVPSIEGRYIPGARFVVDLSRRGNPVVVDDALADPRFDAAIRRRWAELGARAVIGVPLVKSGRWIASLYVNSTDARTWRCLDVRLVQDTTERTWAAAEQALAEHVSAAERARRLAVERTLAEQAARERRELLEQEFITNAAHELRTPLTGILGAVDVLAAGGDGDPMLRRRFLTHLRREATRLGRLADSLLQLAQTQFVGALPRQPVAIGSVLETAVQGCVVEGGLTISVRAAPELMVITNRGLAEVLIGNLVANAVKYTAAGEVTLAARRGEGGAVTVEVRDTGSGMDAPTLARARDRFYRRDRTRNNGGFGLGLSIADQAATALGVGLDIASAPGEGTSVTVVFPAPAEGLSTDG
jgi:PAS domain S-box-containing protein